MDHSILTPLLILCGVLILPPLIAAILVVQMWVGIELACLFGRCVKRWRAGP